MSSHGPAERTAEWERILYKQYTSINHPGHPGHPSHPPDPRDGAGQRHCLCVRLLSSMLYSGKQYVTLLLLPDKHATQRFRTQSVLVLWFITAATLQTQKRRLCDHCCSPQERSDTQCSRTCNPRREEPATPLLRDRTDIRMLFTSTANKYIATHEICNMPGPKEMSLTPANARNTVGHRC